MADPVANDRTSAPTGGASIAGETSFHLGYRPWLDGLRGVAILFVLLYHVKLVSGGFLGVDVFFVLSGFLITTLLIEEWQRAGSISLRRFYARRALRLLPALFAILIAGWVYTLFAFSPEESKSFRREAIVSALYIANWADLHQTPMPTLGHTWSLAVEEQFYIVWPLLLCLMLRYRFTRKQIMGVVCLGIAASMTIRFVLFRQHRIHGIKGQEDIPELVRMYTGSDTRADTLLVGCLAALLVSFNLIPNSRRLHRWCGIVSLVALPPFGYLLLTKQMGMHSLYYGLFTLIAALVALIIIYLLAEPHGMASRILEFRPLIWIGRISYSLYLIHGPIFRFMDPTGVTWRNPPKALLAVGVSFAAATVCYYSIERPFLSLKRRFAAAQASGPIPRLSADSTAKDSVPKRAAA